VGSGVDLFKILLNPSLKPRDVNVIARDRCLVQYDNADGFLPEMSHVNVFIAAFTTSNARRRLYKVLLGLGRRVIYFDTDSVVYEYDDRVTEYSPDMGDHLGQWTDELKEGEHITKFVSSGPKSYAYITNMGRQVVKLKGFTLNHENALKLDFQSITSLVLFWADPDTHPLPDDQDPFICARYTKIARDKAKFRLFNREEIKRYRVTYSKRQLIPKSFDTLPYGY
jgi:hypothetical protein